jgi:long-chain acyl-CoA synthetase
LFIKESDNIALVWKELKITYTQLLHKINQFAALTNLPPDSKIAICSENRLEWVYAFYATWLNQSICIPIDFMATADEIAYVLMDSKPAAVYYSKETEVNILKAIEQLDYQPILLSFDDINEAGNQAVEKQFSIEPENVAVIIYTSGTTGSPKGVMLTYKNILANITAVTEEVPFFTSDQRVMILLPLHHIFPLLGSLIAPLIVGGRVAFSPSMASEDIIETLQVNKITMIIGVPKFYDTIRKGIVNKIKSNAIARLLFLIAKGLGSITVSKMIFKTVHKRLGGHIKYMICGGAKLDVQIYKDFRTLGFDLYEGFGMTEAAPMITFPRLGKTKAGSAGQELFKDSVRIVDGEITAGGAQIMKGYYNKPEETAETIKNGWLYTGDKGYLDKKGYLHITGRIKEIIVLPSGKNINPVEIETKIENMSDLVSEIGVLQKEDTLFGVIVPDLMNVKKHGETEIIELIRWEVIDKYNKKVAPYKQIRGFSLVHEPLPRTRLEKLQRHKLLSLVNDTKADRKLVSEPNNPEYHVIKNYLKRHALSEIYPDDHIEFDIGIDSLDKVVFQSFLSETFGIEIKEKIFLDYPTVKKLADFISQEKVIIEEKVANWSSILKESMPVKLASKAYIHIFINKLMGMLIGLYFRVKVKGAEHLPETPFILAPNHQTYLDSIFVTKLLKRKMLKNTYFFAKGKHFSKKWRQIFARYNNIIVMNLNEDLVETIQKMAEVLKKNKNIVIFPEGTRTRDGQLGRFKDVFSILSCELQIPVIPVAIQGGYEAMPRGTFLPKPFQKVSVNYLPAIPPGTHSYESLSNQVKSDIAEKMKNVG